MPELPIPSAALVEQLDAIVATTHISLVLSAIATSLQNRTRAFQNKLDPEDASDSDLFDQADANLEIADGIFSVSLDAVRDFPLPEAENDVPEGQEAYLVPVSYTMTGNVRIVAKTSAEALKLAEHVDTSAVTDAEYLGDSWEVQEQEFEDSYPESIEFQEREF